MSRAVSVGLFALFVTAGCQLPPERLPLRPLPEEGPPLPYAELLTRARLQASTATEAFYVSRWSDLEDSARGMQQTARYLEKAIEVPPRHKDTLPAEAKELEKEATSLREAAEARDVKRTNETLQRINLRVRDLRPED